MINTEKQKARPANNKFFLSFGLYVSMAINIKVRTAIAQGFTASTAAKEISFINVNSGLSGGGVLLLLSVLFEGAGITFGSPFHWKTHPSVLMAFSNSTFFLDRGTFTGSIGV